MGMTSVASRKGTLAAGLLAGAMLWGAGAADASTFDLSANTANTLNPGNVYDTGFVKTTANANFSNDYYFTVGLNLETINSATTFHPDASNNIGIKNAKLEIFSGGSVNNPASRSPLVTLLISNSSGLDLGLLPTLVYSLVAGNYDFRVSGTTLSGGGNYDLSVIATPLPGALALFGSALVGLGLLGRRRRKHQTDAV